MPIVYIRVLKYDAQRSPVKSALDITLALTLTTDLGDASHPHSTPLECQLSTRLGRETVRLEWSGTRAVQKYRLEIAYDSVFGKSLDRTYQVSISALDTPVMDQTEGGTVGVGRSPQFLTKFIGSPCLTSGRLVVPLSFTQTLEIPFEKSIERRFTVEGRQVSFIEETQESIVSHIWDAGMLLSALFSSIIDHTESEEPSTPRAKDLASLWGTLRTIFDTGGTRVVELGTGIGLIGIVLSHLPDLEVTVTDLPTAETLVSRNIELAKGRRSRVTFQALDWTEDESAFSTPVDVLVMTDVIYNETYHDALWQTINRLTTDSHGRGSSQERKCGKRRKKGHKAPIILFASKYRHVSERVFIDRLKTQYRVLSETIFDGDSFCITDNQASIGDVEILVLSVA